MLCLGNDRLLIINYSESTVKIFNMRSKKVLLKTDLASISIFDFILAISKSKIIKYKGDIVLAEDLLIFSNSFKFQYIYSREQYSINLKGSERSICKSLTRKRLFTQRDENVKAYALKQSTVCLTDTIPLPLDHRIEYMKHVGDDYLCGFVSAYMPILLVIQISTRKVIVVNLDVMSDCETLNQVEYNEVTKIAEGDMDIENTDKKNGLKMIQVTQDTILSESETMKKMLFCLIYCLLAKVPY